MGERLREQRERAGLTQKQLESATGIPQSALSAIEAGRRGVPGDRLAKIASALRIPTDRLVPPKPHERREEPSPSPVSDRDRKLADSREAFLVRFAAELAPADVQALQTMVFLVDSDPGFAPDDQFWWDLVEVARRRRERARSRGAGR